MLYIYYQYLYVWVFILSQPKPCHDLFSCERFQNMTGSKQTALTGLARCLLWTDHYSVCLRRSCLSHIYDLQKQLDLERYNPNLQTHSVQWTQRQDARRQSTHKSAMVAKIKNYAKRSSKDHSDFRALSVRPFNKIEFSIERRFQKCFFFIKAFWDNSKYSTLSLTSFTKFLFAMNGQGPKL